MTTLVNFAASASSTRHPFTILAQAAGADATGAKAAATAAKAGGEATVSLWSPLFATAGDFVLTISSTFLSIAMVVGMVLVFLRLRSLKRGFGPLTFRLIAALLFIPALFFLTVTESLEKQALTALWGAVAGYLLAEQTRGGTSSTQSEPPQTEAASAVVPPFPPSVTPPVTVATYRNLFTGHTGLSKTVPRSDYDSGLND